MTGSGAMVEVVGGIAGILSCVSLVPQVLRCWRRRSVDDISYGWLITGAAATLMWVVYGGLIEGLAIVVTNAVVGGCLLAIAVMKVRWGTRGNAEGR